ncbi:hypothetical protein Q4503_01015 [Colwellia sp. 6_MG-2023]|uniref:hypothetical protein n=1 Tax=Colwellia sp. 6_MG-2023 TaxID=3062676 RepID=UPI0026E1C547|nr:hypothetical protein [Colwellia sp. 6_MG-2023]MDO6486259.1 hypothetical protein [Colwellia sp. 6_MG-2023]
MFKQLEHQIDSPLFHLYEGMNKIFQSRNIYENCNIQDDKLVFVVRRGFKKICDFSFFDENSFHVWNEQYITFQGNVIPLKFKEYAKLIFIFSMPDTDDGDALYNHFIHLKSLFTFMKNENIIALDENNLKSLYSLLITHDLSNHKFKKRFSLSNHSRIKSFPEKKIRLAFSRFKCEEVIPRANYSKLKNEVCLNITGMTYEDFKKGGTFDYLGLEIGKHYIDHCGTIFQEHGLYTAASRLTLENFSPPKGISLNQNTKSIIAQVLSGVEITNLIPQQRTTNKKILDIARVTKKLFAKEYNRHASLFKVGDINLINKILRFIDIPERFDNQEFIRSLMFTLIEKNRTKSIDGYVEEYRSLLKDSEHSFDKTNNELIEFITEALVEDKISINDVTKICIEHFNKLKVLSPNSLHKGILSLTSHLALAESAGCSLFVALTGWRCSEFGFPLSSVKISINSDPLDNAYSPYRFHVNWVVPKTSGETKLDREITLGSYLIAQKLHIMNLSGNSTPCLFKRNYQRYKKDQPLSEVHITTVIGKRIRRCWFKFPFEYSLFKELEVDNSQYIEALSDLETESLKKVKNEVQEGIGKFTLINTKNIIHTTIGKKLEAYRDGTLNELETNILSDSLSEKTKKRILEVSNITRDISSAITEEILNDVRYPTPHSFRHMWAEAVLLRYRGDVGKFIRANFKHLDERFFVAYLRNKETKTVMNVAKRQIISSIVREQMYSAKIDAGAYTGGFDRFINKVILITKILSEEDYISKVNEISDSRILDVKVNAWGTCMLRKGTLSTAKCSKEGEPQRFNAEPKLCLGCTNVNISEGNFTGIVIYTKGDIDTCRHPDLPFFVKKPCIQTVNLAYKRVTELHNKDPKDKYAKFINYLEESIKIAEESKGEVNHE